MRPSLITARILLLDGLCVRVLQR